MPYITEQRSKTLCAMQEKFQTHILNGDSLREQLPESVRGQKLVVRECMCEGKIDVSIVQHLFLFRAKFFEEVYQVPKFDYWRKTQVEFEKLMQLAEAETINFWFEEDLFCQCNFWFCVYLITMNQKANPVFLVLPDKENRYGFSGMSQEGLEAAYRKKRELSPSDLQTINDLFIAYAKGENEQMPLIAENLGENLECVKNAVAMHLERLQEIGGKPKHEHDLLQLSEELGTTDFKPLFRAFMARYEKFGYGDMLVKRIYDKVF